MRSPLSRFPRLLALPLLFALYAPSAWSQSCLPFTDVLQSDSFCTSTQWLRNANVTLGCGGTGYCPFEPVTRAQMALFMHRLSKAVAPAVSFVESSSMPDNADLDTGPGVVLCETPATHPAEAVPNPRYWHGEGNVSFKAAGNAPVDIQVRLEASQDGGSNETANMIIPNASAAAGAWGTAHVMAGLGNAIHPGENMTFRLRVYRALGSTTTAELGEVRCQLKITVVDLHDVCTNCGN